MISSHSRVTETDAQWTVCSVPAPALNQPRRRFSISQHAPWRQSESAGRPPDCARSVGLNVARCQPQRAPRQQAVDKRPWHRLWHHSALLISRAQGRVHEATQSDGGVIARWPLALRQSNDLRHRVQGHCRSGGGRHHTALRIGRAHGRVHESSQSRGGVVARWPLALREADHLRHRVHGHRRSGGGGHLFPTRDRTPWVSGTGKLDCGGWAKQQQCRFDFCCCTTRPLSSVEQHDVCTKPPSDVVVSSHAGHALCVRPISLFSASGLPFVTIVTCAPRTTHGAT